MSDSQPVHQDDRPSAGSPAVPALRVGEIRGDAGSRIGPATGVRRDRLQGRGVLAFLFALAFIAMLVAGGFLAGWYQDALTGSLDVPANTTFVVEPGQGLRSISVQMTAAGLVQHPRIVEIYARVTGLGRRLQAGEYAVPPGSSVRDLLQRMADGRIVQHRLTIPEGRLFADVVAAIASHASIRRDEALDTLATSRERIWRRAGIDPEWVAARESAEIPDAGWLEGLFLPDTYQFSRGQPASSVLDRGVRALGAELDRVWQARIEDHPAANPYELLVLASIIEKETAVATERGQVAGVFVNRLRDGMRLQTDPTLLYGAEPGTRLTRAELRRDHAYNTYTRAGLPPTPIALPGRASLQAAARPDATDARFFVARGDGTHVFSRTYREHREAVIRHQLGGDASRYGGGS